MREQDLQIHLRRRYVEQAQARRPRLPQRLRALGAVGPVLRPLPAHSQQAFVQVRVTNVSTTGRHLSYLTHAKEPARQDATLFGPAAAATRRFVQEAQHDPHQFRLVVNVPDHARLDRTRYIALYMAQVERDLGRPLDWVAAHHFDTQHPHTHMRIGKSNGIFAPVSPGAHPRNPTAWTPHRLCIQLPAPTRSARWRGLGCVSRVLRGRGLGHGRWWQAREGRWHTGVHRLCTHVTDGTTPRVVGLVEHGACVAITGQGNGRWNGRELEMPQDTRDH
jgi:hypothetical protein